MFRTTRHGRIGPFHLTLLDLRFSIPIMMGSGSSVLHVIVVEEIMTPGSGSLARRYEHFLGPVDVGWQHDLLETACLSR
jgi:hypothetical protein